MFDYAVEQLSQHIAFFKSQGGFVPFGHKVYDDAVLSQTVSYYRLFNFYSVPLVCKAENDTCPTRMLSFLRTERALCECILQFSSVDKNIILDTTLDLGYYKEKEIHSDYVFVY